MCRTVQKKEKGTGRRGRRRKGGGGARGEEDVVKAIDCRLLTLAVR